MVDAPVPQISTPDWFQSAMMAMTHGASWVYHHVVDAEDSVSTWELNHPAVGPLIKQGEQFAMNLMASYGVPVPTVITVADGVLAALRNIAALDPTVDSGK